VNTQRQHSVSGRLRRLVSPSTVARANAAQALEEMRHRGDALVLHAADLGAFSPDPSGPSQRHCQGRLGTALWEAFPDHVALLDRDAKLIAVNRAWREFGLTSGAEPTTGLGRNYLQVCELAAACGEPEAEQAAALVREALAGLEPGRQLSYLCGSGGEDRWFRMRVIPLPGRHSGALVVHGDVTADREREQQWQHRALHDPLTGLLNRGLLADRLEHAVLAADRGAGSMAVLFIDLDNFKSVNDSLGHRAGDQVLREAGRRMAAAVRDADTIGRWGGDEFLVIAERLDTRATAAELVGRLRAAMSAPIDVGPASLAVRASVGVAFRDHRRHTADELIQTADDELRANRRDARRGSAAQP